MSSNTKKKLECSYPLILVLISQLYCTDNAKEVNNSVYSTIQKNYTITSNCKKPNITHTQKKKLNEYLNDYSYANLDLEALKCMKYIKNRFRKA